MPAFLDLLGVYLVPFALALPVALGLVWLTSRRGEPPPDEPRDEAPTRARASPPATARAPSADDIPTVPAAEPPPAVLARAALQAAASSAAHPGAAAPPAMPSRPAAASPLPPRVLVADDSAVVRAKMRRLLVGAGFVVDLASDGAEALALLPQQRYDLLITDLEMPEVDGFELIAHVRGALDTEDLPVLAITGHEALSARVHDCQGLYGIFRKPWNDRELLQRATAVARLRHGRVPQPAPAVVTDPA
jgi:CheY-like chemotaxis protein